MDPQFEAFVNSVMSKPISFVTADGKKRNVYASTNSPGGISVASKHARNRLSMLAQKLLNEDSNSLLSISHVSPAKQARAMRTRIARYSGKPGPVGSEEPWGNSALDEGGNSPKGKSIRIGSNDDENDEEDPSDNIILGGGRSNRHNIHLAHLHPKSGSQSGRHTSGPRISPIRSNANLDLGDISSSPSNKLKLVPLTLRRDPHANRPHPDISIEPVSSSVTEWSAPTRLYVWGSGVYGQLGCGLDDGKPSVPCSLRPMRLDLPSEVGQGEFQSSGSKLTPIRVACGYTVTGVVDNQRRVWTTGDGWLGRGIKERSHVPILVQGIGSGSSQVIDLACGKGFMVCCTVEGGVFVWGENLGLASLKASTDAKKFRKDVTAIGSPIKVDKHTTLMTKISPEKQQTNNEESSMGHPLGLAGGEVHRVPLPKQIPSSFFQNHEAIVSVAAGEGHIVALSNDGNVYTWGAGTSGACGHGSGEHQWVPKMVKLRPRRIRPAGSFRVSGSSGRTAGDGEHGGWGSDTENIDGGADGTGSVSGASAFGRGTSTSPSNTRRLASIAESSSSSSTNALPAHMQQSKAFAISAGAHHTAILAVDGTAFVCGFAEKGRLGLGIDVPTAITKPTQILGLPPLVAIACGEAHTLFLSVEGRIYASGDNAFGQCGINTRIFKPSPFMRTDINSGSQTEVTVETRVLVPRQVFTSLFGPVLATRIAAGARHSAAVDISGRMWSWGFNTDGTLGDGTDVTAPEPVKVARFAEVCVLQASLSSSHTATIISRNRVTTKSTVSTTSSSKSEDGNTEASISSIISQLEDDSGLVSALEVPLPLLLKRLRRHSIHIRMKAVAFGTNFKRKKARERRRRAVRMAMTRHLASSLDSGSSLTDSVDGYGEIVQVERAKHRYAVAEKVKLDGQSWESDPDIAEYGKNAACHVIQTSFLLFLQKKAIKVKQLKSYKEQSAVFTRKAEMKRQQKN
jgi:alpha-tubulin suppressor-like RCC1 family protein